MNDHREQMKRCEAFAKTHVVACSREILSWQDSNGLGDGKMSELSRMVGEFSGNTHSLRIAESLVTRAAFEFVAASGAND